eukprot:185480-Chlamydomonas_euryale.AAC.2
MSDVDVAHDGRPGPHKSRTPRLNWCVDGAAVKAHGRERGRDRHLSTSLREALSGHQVHASVGGIEHILQGDWLDRRPRALGIVIGLDA